MTQYNKMRGIVGRLKELEKTVRENNGAPRLSYSSIHNGGITEYDADNNMVSRVGTQWDGTHGAVDIYGPVPPKPTEPTLSAEPVSLTITWDGHVVDENDDPRPLPLDFQCVQIMVSSVGPPTVDDLRGVITSEAGGAKSLSVPSGTWYVSLRTRARSGRMSDLTESVSIAVPATVDVGAIEADIAAAQADAAAALIGASDAEVAAAAAQAVANAAADDAADAIADAAAAAGLAADKGKVVIQPTAPDVGDQLAQNLWIDTTGGNNTPKRWTGSAWEAVTDKAATDAASAAATALSTANDAASDALAANTAAGNALTAANGKSRVSFGTSAPTGSTPGKPGDIFWVRSGSDIVAQYLCTAGTDIASGNTWAAQTLTNETIATLDAAKITTGTLNAGRIAAKSMTLDKLLIASVDNLLINPDFELGTGAPTGWSPVDSTVVNVTDGPDTVAVNVLRVTPLSADVSTTNTAFPLGSAGTVVEHGKSYRFTARARLVSGTSGLLRIRAGLYRTGETDEWLAVTDDLDAAVEEAGEWLTLTGTLTMPTTHDRLSVSIHASSASGSVFEIADVSMRSMSDSSLVVDGSITTQALGAQSVQVENLAAGSVTGETLAGEIILGSTIKTSESGQRVQMDTAGIQLVGPDEEIRVDLPTVPGGEPTFRGVVQADGLTVREGATFYSTLNSFAKDSTVSLDQSLSAPTSAPIATIHWPSVQLEQTAYTAAHGTFALDPSQIVHAAYRPGSPGTFTVLQRKTSTKYRVWYYNLDGTLAALSPAPIWDLPNDWVDITSVAYGSDGEARIMFKNTGTNDWWIYDAAVAPGGTRFYGTRAVNKPLLGMDGTTILVTETTNDGGTRMRTVETTSSSTNVTVVTDNLTTGDPSKSAQPNVIMRGSADFGGTRWITAYPSSGTYRVFSSGYAYTEAENWSPPVVKAGAFWAPDLSQFVTIGNDGRAWFHSGIAWTDDFFAVWHAGQTFYDSNATGGTHETALGLVTSFTMQKRAHVRFTLVEVPFAGGVDDPNEWRLYVTRSSGGWLHSTIRLQTSGPYTQSTVTMSTVPTFGDPAPTTSNFPGGNPAKLVSAGTMADTLPTIQLNGDGSGRWGLLTFDSAGRPSWPGDTDWIPLTPMTGFTALTGAYVPYVRAWGPFILFRGRFSTTGTNSDVTTLPAEITAFLSGISEMGTWSVDGTFRRMSIQGGVITRSSAVSGTVSIHGVTIAKTNPSALF